MVGQGEEAPASAKEPPSFNQVCDWLRDKPELRAMMHTVSDYALSKARYDNFPELARYAAGLAIYLSFNDDVALRSLQAEVERLRAQVLENARLTPMPGLYIPKPG